MNRYAPWQYTLVAIAMVVGLVYTLPNFFGEVPAVQVSPVRATLKVDDVLQARVEDLLKKGAIRDEGVFFDSAGVKVRFADTDTQLKAKDVLQGQLGDDVLQTALQIRVAQRHAKPLHHPAIIHAPGLGQVGEHHRRHHLLGLGHRHL